MSDKIEFVSSITIRNSKITKNTVSGNVENIPEEQKELIKMLRPLANTFVRAKVIGENKIQNGSAKVRSKFRRGTATQSIEFKVLEISKNV